MARNIPSNENQRLQPRVLYLTTFSNKMGSQIRSFPDKRSLIYTSTKPTLQEMLKRLLQGKEGKERERERQKNTGTKNRQ